MAWLDANGRPPRPASLDYLTQVASVTDLWTRPKVGGVWRGSLQWPDVAARRDEGRSMPLPPPNTTTGRDELTAFVRAGA